MIEFVNCLGCDGNQHICLNQIDEIISKGNTAIKLYSLHIDELIKDKYNIDYVEKSIPYLDTENNLIKITNQKVLMKIYNKKG